MAQQSKTRTHKKETAPRTRSSELGRYVLTGAGLGLYFGLFFQPLREPNLLTPPVLGFVAALLMTLLTLRRPEARSLPAALRYGLRAWLGLTLALLLLEARHPVYGAAGKAGVTVFMTVMGAAAGVLYAWRDGKLSPGSGDR